MEDSQNKFPQLWGSVCFNSRLSLKEIGTILSDRLFLGLQFSGLENHIYEEVPTVYLNGRFLGLNIILQGGGEFDFCLEVNQNFNIESVENYRVQMDTYLYNLLKQNLSDIDEIFLLEP